MPDDTQKAFNASVEDDIKKQISKDVDKTDDKSDKKTEPVKPKADTGKTDDSGKDKKNVDKKDKKSDTDTDDLSNASESELFEATVDKIVMDEFDGDDSKRDQAKGIANLAIKTFSGDPVKAAKSYKHLFDQSHTMKSVIKKNPFIEKLITEASQGKPVDENYVKNLLGTATSADEPAKKNTDDSKDKLEDVDLDDFDPDKLTEDQLIESGALDKTKYDAATSIDKRDMLEKARIRYSYKVLPVKMAEKSAKLTQKKLQDQTKQEQIDTAKSTNKERLLNSQREFVTKYNVDFEGNPEHAELFEEIYNKAVRIPDIDDDSGYLVAEDAFEHVAERLFKQRGIELEKADISDDDPDEGGDPVEKATKSNSADIMRRILSGANGFSGAASKRQHKQERKEKSENNLDSKVNERVTDALNRSYTTTKMISGVRKTDRTKS